MLIVHIMQRAQKEARGLIYLYEWQMTELVEESSPALRLAQLDVAIRASIVK